MNKFNKGISLPLVIIIVAVVLIGGGLVYYYTTKTLTEPGTDQQQNTQNQTDETVGWKTYTNSSYNFSFQYPAVWGEPLESKNNQTSIRVGDLQITIGSFFSNVLGRNMTVDENISSIYKAPNREDIIVGGKPAVKITTPANGTPYQYLVCIPLNAQKDEMIVISQTQLLDIFATMLSTFKFTN